MLCAELAFIRFRHRLGSPEPTSAGLKQNLGFLELFFVLLTPFFFFRRIRLEAIASRLEATALLA